MQRIRGESPLSASTKTDDATRIVAPISPETRRTQDGAEVAERGGAIIGSAGGRETPSAKEPKPGETVFIPNAADLSTDQRFDPVVGWLVVRKGPGKGQFRPVFYGQNSIGRAPDQRVNLDFGDQRISRQCHAFLIYDDVAQKFYIRDGGKTSLVRLNGELLMTPAELRDRDEVAIGGTTLLFVALCCPEFDWLTTESQGGTGEAGKAAADESNQ